jgi:2-dehydropantoate 2-reductase
MRIGVIGAGAVGGAFAALLTRHGHEVEVTARGTQLDAIRDHGIRLTGKWGDYTAIVHAEELLTRAAELVIVATKAQDATTAIRENIAMLRDVPVVVIQNGIDSVAGAEAASPRSDIVGGLAMFASSYLTDGAITITTSGRLYLGVSREHSDVPARYAARILNDVIPTMVIANFAGAQWTKLLVNQVNALPAITGLSVQEVIADRRLRRVVTACMRETARIGRASGVRFEKLDRLTRRVVRTLAFAPLWFSQTVPKAMARRMGRVPNPGSTLQSVRRGRATEIEHLNGSVVRAAEAIGRSAPVNAAIVMLVHEVEGTGTFLTPAEVVARLR